MKFLIILAWKNLFRHTKRTFITASSIAVGLMLFIIIDSLLMGIANDSTRNLIDYETSFFKIHADEYWEEKDTLPLDYTISSPQKIIEAVQKAGYEAAPRTVFRAEMIIYKDPFPEDGSLQVKLIGISPDQDPEVFETMNSLVKGRSLENDENGVVIGAWLAEDIGADIGYPITFITRTKNGFYQTFDSEVVGIVNTPNPLVNRGHIYIPMETADYYMEMGGAVTEIGIKASLQAKIPKVRSELEDALKLSEDTESSSLTGQKLELFSWEQVGSDFVALAAAKDSGTQMILFLVFIIAAIGISNTMLMAVYERKQEVGMLRAMGMYGSEIRWTFIFEAAGIGLIGSIIGVILGASANYFMVEYGINYGFLMRDMAMGYRITDVAYGYWSPATFTAAFFLGIFLTMLVAILPTRKFLKLEITDCLRNQ
ncbi:MAG: FtsX-like permease family protein [Spirochaetia bacterium]|nr:FtsX-like permease family protein [Spirochaetia bacterium]MCF7952939.1 FtsX-like permease family protein [Spirochaetales bacterium]